MRIDKPLSLVADYFGVKRSVSQYHSAWIEDGQTSLNEGQYHAQEAVKALVEPYFTDPVAARVGPALVDAVVSAETLDHLCLEASLILPWSEYSRQGTP
ncbi:hypothetical protein ElyMa_001209500 [Elysia marginata]|uniref:Uncharacterized protein n=1 Tax=Elysia marginata TaxID=1093978 RepID=A0AAV4I9P4_9GAST|nr:hypothetical protein ElyMa_001209500 [Elysia marginata]